MPDPLAGRLVAQHLLDHLPATAKHARAVIAAQIAENEWPSPEELALLRRLFADDMPGLASDVAAALGTAPTIPVNPLPETAIRAHRWLVAVPESAAPEWQRADASISEQIGAASHDGVRIRGSATRFTGASSPIALEDLTALPPVEAAERVAAWRLPPGSSFLDPSAGGLAGTLRQTIEADPDRWLAADPVVLANALRHPVYITVLLQALSERAKYLPDAERVVVLVELVRSGPWEVEELASGLEGPGGSWAGAGDEAIKLLGRLGELRALDDGDLADRAWAQVLDAVRRRGDTTTYVEDQERDPLSAAINRPSMRAVEVAFSIAENAPRAKLLALVDELLDLDGVDGLHSRAMLARRLPWLRSAAPEWFAERGDRIFGDAERGPLGPAAFDLYLEWGTPHGPLLRDERERLIAALGRNKREEAIQHLLHGLLWRLPGFEVPAVADILIGAGHEAISYAGQWLGWALSEVDDVDLGPVIELWRELLDRRLPADAYRGFGWMAVNARVDDDVWLGLMQTTTTATAGALDEPNRIAERAAQTPGDPRAASVIAQLLADDPTPWDLQRIGAFGLDVLPSVTDDAAAADLRERLLERGFNAALDP